MPLPNFFVIGAAKSGTTALYHTLAQHPDVYMSPVKEPCFFAYPEGRPAFAGPRGGPSGPRVITEPHQYLALFAGVGGESAIGEASALYLRSATAARRIRHNLPDARLVAVLRNPAERAYSSYWFLVDVGIERAPTFEDALAREPSRMDSGWFPGVFHRANGLYHAQLSAYFDLFPHDQIKVYLYEDWRVTPREMLQDLFGFLGVDPSFHPEPGEINVSRAPRTRWAHRRVRRSGRPALTHIDRAVNSAAPPPMQRQTRQQLLDGYREDVGRLEALIGRDLSPWMTQPPENEDEGAPG